MTVARSRRPDLDTGAVTVGHGHGRHAAKTRDTPRKRALLEVMENADGFLSAAELHERIRAHLAPRGLRVGITTVYNQLRRLADTSVVDTLHGDDGETRYWLPRQARHHHYLVCRSCGLAVEVVAEPVESWADAFGVTAGFRDVSHTFELYGLCERCGDPVSQARNGTRGSHSFSSELDERAD
jgi:Fur family transcriptional regulator, ferric uptake regulator